MLGVTATGRLALLVCAGAAIAALAHLGWHLGRRIARRQAGTDFLKGPGR